MRKKIHLEIMHFMLNFGETISEDKIFEEKLVELNKDICKIIIYNKEYELCSYLKDINIELKKDIYEIKLKQISKIVDISYMFCGCLSLSSIIDIDKIKTGNFTSLSCAFLRCKSLDFLSDISKWNTSNDTNMNGLF